MHPVRRTCVGPKRLGAWRSSSSCTSSVSGGDRFNGGFRDWPETSLSDKNDLRPKLSPGRAGCGVLLKRPTQGSLQRSRIEINGDVLDDRVDQLGRDRPRRLIRRTFDGLVN